MCSSDLQSSVNDQVVSDSNQSTEVSDGQLSEEPNQGLTNTDDLSHVGGESSRSADDEAPDDTINNEESSVVREDTDTNQTFASTLADEDQDPFESFSGENNDEQTTTQDEPCVDDHVDGDKEMNKAEAVTESATLLTEAN